MRSVAILSVCVLSPGCAACSAGAAAESRSLAVEDLPAVERDHADIVRGAGDSVVKRPLTVWISAASAGCQRLWHDLSRDPALHDALLTRFQLRWVDADRHHAAAASRGIKSLPTFDLGDR